MASCEESTCSNKKITCMNYELYRRILEKVEHLPCTAIDVAKTLAESFPNVSHKTLGSIYAQEYQRKTKRHHQKHCSSEASSLYYSKYVKSVEEQDPPGIIIRIAEEAGLSSSLMARIIIEQHLIKNSPTSETIKQQISRLMKDTSLIQDKDLAYEVFLCVLQDDNYGPLADVIKHSIGHEYEWKLRSLLQENDLCFIEEDQMRDRGYDKTPDFKMEIPFAVDGYIVNWIESKASFGDTESHQTYLKDQYWSYWNRFGSGMVIYWFGYIEELDIHRQKGILLQSDFPNDIVKMDPTAI